ncbi:hypothetical protein OF83DRAFT_476681 [Amylostereum chailletii]|nr:hypothetical protein OF83DRAFT_476681 [Amylostereum chailletii]
MTSGRFTRPHCAFRMSGSTIDFFAMGPVSRPFANPISAPPSLFLYKHPCPLYPRPTSKPKPAPFHISRTPLLYLNISLIVMLITSFIILAGIWVSTILTPASFPDFRNIYIHIPSLSSSVSILKNMLQTSHSESSSRIHWQQHFYVPSSAPPSGTLGRLNNATASTPCPSFMMPHQQATSIQSPVLPTGDAVFNATSRSSSNVLLGCFVLTLIFLFACLV